MEHLFYSFINVDSNNKILVILTGGRIDSVWDGNVDEIVIARNSVIPAFFKSIGINLEFEFVEACMKDSRALTSEDREKIRKALDDIEPYLEAYAFRG